MLPSSLQTKLLGRQLACVLTKCARGILRATSESGTPACKVHLSLADGLKCSNQWLSWSANLMSLIASATPWHSQQWRKVRYGDKPWWWHRSCKTSQFQWTNWHAVPLAVHTLWATFGKNLCRCCADMANKFAWTLWCRIRFWMHMRNQQSGAAPCKHVRWWALQALNKIQSAFVQWWAAAGQAAAGHGWLALWSICGSPTSLWIWPAAFLQIQRTDVNWQ